MSSCEQKKNKQKGKMKEFMSFFFALFFSWQKKKKDFHQTNRIFVDERSINQPLNQSLNQSITQFNAMDSNNATTQI